MIIQRLKHDAISMEEGIFGWDIFKCADYSVIDSSTSGFMGPEAIRSKIIKGHTIILALNIGKIRLFKKLFIRI